MKKQFIVSVSLEEAGTILKFCEWAGRSPLDILLNACGLPEREPYIFDIKYLVNTRNFNSWEQIEERARVLRTNKGDQNKIFLKLLSQLLKWNEAKVSEALPMLHGTKRIYFSKDSSEIWNSGNNMAVHRIPDTDWYACTHWSGDYKEEIFYKLMRRLGFSIGYGRFISSLIKYRNSQIYGHFFELVTPKN